ncbi:hypothetical protein D3C80_1240200 [compost metagenome]
MLNRHAIIVSAQANDMSIRIRSREPRKDLSMLRHETGDITIANGGSIIRAARIHAAQTFRQVGRVDDRRKASQFVAPRRIDDRGELRPHRSDSSHEAPKDDRIPDLTGNEDIQRHHFPHCVAANATTSATSTDASFNINRASTAAGDAVTADSSSARAFSARSLSRYSRASCRWASASCGCRRSAAI